MNTSIWKIGLFEKSKDGKMAECRECKENGMPKYEFKLSDSSTKSLKCHLFSTTHANSEYVKNFEELEKTKKESKQKAEKQQQPTIENLIDTTLTSSGILSLADKRIISMITCNNLSFGLLSDPAFKAQCKYELKDESDYRKRVLPEAYKLVRAKILKDLDGCANLSFTIDCWAGPSDNFLSLTGHGITKNWVQKNFVLAVHHFPGQHSGNAIACNVRKLLDSWKINDERVFAFVTDSAANMRKAFTEVDENFNKILPFEYANCASHLLHLVVKEGLNADPSIKLLLEQCRKIVGHFKKSNKAFSILREIQQILEAPEHSLLQEVSVRWNSALQMAQRLLEQKKAITQYAVETGDTNFSLTVREWSLLEELISVLKSTEEASNWFAKSPISSQIPAARCMHKQLFNTTEA